MTETTEKKADPEMDEKYERLHRAIEKHRGRGGALTQVLQEAQEAFGYAPRDVQIEKDEKYERLHRAIEKHRGSRGALMQVLQEAQAIFGYVPQDVQIEIAKGLDVPLTEVYGVATFYSQFALEPQGKHVIGVCLGTACYVKGAQKVMDTLKKSLKIDVGHTTEDGRFTLNATRCLGCCGLAPVMMIGDDVYGRLTPDDIPGILAKYDSCGGNI